MIHFDYELFTDRSDDVIDKYWTSFHQKVHQHPRKQQNTNKQSRRIGEPSLPVQEMNRKLNDSFEDHIDW